MKKQKFFLLSALAAGIGYVVSAASVSAAVPTATSTLDTLMTIIIGTTVDLATVIFTTYWPYILIFGIIASIVAVAVHFLKVGTKK
jgi:hypothetical protein